MQALHVQLHYGNQYTHLEGNNTLYNQYQKSKTGMSHIRSYRYTKTIGTNFHAYVITRSGRLAAQIPYLSRQLGLGATVTQAYKQATKRPYGYLMVYRLLCF